MSRGMTLLEVLVSLALLSALSVASLGYTRMARELAQTAQPLSWGAAADRVLDQIRDDLFTGDFALESPSAETDGRSTAESEREHRVRVADKKTLQIRTRSRTRPTGTIVRTYLVDEQGRLVVTDGNEPARVLLDHLSLWRCQIISRPSVPGTRNSETETWIVVSMRTDQGLERSRSLFIEMDREKRPR